MHSHGWKLLRRARNDEPRLWQRDFFTQNRDTCDFTAIVLAKQSIKKKKKDSTNTTTAANLQPVVNNDNNKHSLEEEVASDYDDKDDDDGDDDSAKLSNSMTQQPDDAIHHPPITPQKPSTLNAKFKVFQTVYARDATDGVMYEAVIRRRLYGLGQPRQVQVGLVGSAQEVLDLMNREEEPAWHYFVHYNKWNVNWDRWVPEEDVYEMSPKVKEYAQRLVAAHRDLRTEMTRKVKGKKGFQTIDGTQFLQNWRLRMAAIDAEMEMPGSSTMANGSNSGAAEMSTGPSVQKTTVALKPRNDSWTRAAVQQEKKLRSSHLSGKAKSGNTKIALPFALKKVLVEQWEIITQCQMVPSLPAPVTVRQALDMYLESKGVVQKQEEKTVETADKAGEKDNASPAANGDKLPEENVPGAEMELDREPTTTVPGSKEPISEAAVTVTSQNDTASMTESKETNGGKEKDKPDKENDPAEEPDAREREWHEMADGIALFFDEALPCRLLYRDELPQLSVLDSHPEYSLRPYSEIFGCEHLLRLFVRLQAMIDDELSDAESKPIYAKINDFVRFLHKNQGTMLAQTHRRLNDLEQKEKSKLVKAEERKRKRALEALALSSTVPTTDDSPTPLSKKQRVGEKETLEKMEFSIS